MKPQQNPRTAASMNAGHNYPAQCAYALFVLFAIGIAVMTYLTPKLQEDLEFMASNTSYLNGLSSMPDFGAMWDDITFHYAHTNGRLGDKLPIPVLCLFPEWIIAVMNGLAAWLLITGICRLAKISSTSRRGGWLLILTCPLLLLSFPWQEDVFLVSYSLNYLYSAAIAVWCSIAFCDDTMLRRMNPSALMFWAPAFFLAGAWHECIALSAGAGFIAIILTNKEFRTRRIILGACMAAGFLTILLAGGQQERVGSSEISFDLANLMTFKHGIPFPTNGIIPVVIYFLAFAMMLMIVKRPEAMSLHLLFLTGSMANLAMYGIFGVERSMTVGLVYADAGILNILWQTTCRLKNKAAAIGAGCVIIAVTAIACVNLTLSILMQQKVMKAFRTVKELWNESPDGTVFHDLPEQRSLHANPWEMIITDMYLSEWKQYYLAHYLNPAKSPKQLIIIPERLEHPDFSTVRHLEGDSSIYVLEGELMYSNPDHTDMNIHAEKSGSYTSFGMAIFEASYNDGTRNTVYAHIHPFRPKNSNDTLFYLNPLNPSRQLDIANITGADNLHIIPPESTVIESKLR